MYMINQLFEIDVQCTTRRIHFPECALNHWVSHDQFFLRVPGVATYQVCARSNTIYIDPNPSLTEPHIINTWLNGTVLAYLLQYHGYLVLHGSAIVANEHAVIFSGHSGVGKSTLAMAMSMRGYPFITDDLVVIRKNSYGLMEVMPTFGRVKLWTDTLHQLGQSTDGLQPVLNKSGKFEIPVKQAWTTPVTIAKLYELNHADDIDEIKLTALSPIEIIQLLIKNTYRYAMLKPLGKLDLHLQQITALAQAIEIVKLTRPNHSFRLDDLVQFIGAALDPSNGEAPKKKTKMQPSKLREV